MYFIAEYTRVTYCINLYQVVAYLINLLNWRNFGTRFRT